jgi:hypothetical protein
MARPLMRYLDFGFQSEILLLAPRGRPLAPGVSDSHFPKLPEFGTSQRPRGVVTTSQSRRISPRLLCKIRRTFLPVATRLGSPGKGQPRAVHDVYTIMRNFCPNRRVRLWCANTDTSSATVVGQDDGRSTFLLIEGWRYVLINENRFWAYLVT